MVARYIHGQNKKWLALESARERTVDLSEVERFLLLLLLLLLLAWRVLSSLCQHHQ